MLDTMSATDGLENATMTLDNVLEADRLARQRVIDAVNEH